MAHELVTVEWEGRRVEALVPAPLRELGPVDAEAQRDAARAEGVLTAGMPQHDPRLEVAARQPPLLRVDHRELVPLLQQDPAPAVDQEDAGEETGGKG